jgi:hypothetical protein
VVRPGRHAGNLRRDGIGIRDTVIWRTRPSRAMRRPAASASGKTLRRMVVSSRQESFDLRDSGCEDMAGSPWLADGQWTSPDGTGSGATPS